MSVPATDELSIEQFADRLGMSARTIRFYTGRDLIPAPRREGRNGWYGPDHVARLELVRELQAHGFTLQAIERYLQQIPDTATPAEIAVHRALLAPWMPDLPELVERSELESRAGHALSDDDLEMLIALGVVEPTPAEDKFTVTSNNFSIGLGFLDAQLTTEAALASRTIIEAHGASLAKELTELFRTQVWPNLKTSGQSPELLETMIERFKPLTVQALVAAYETAVDELKRETIRRRA